MFLEVIATSIADVIKINETKAHQIELCAAMENGGYTPDYQLILQACAQSIIPVMVMVRRVNNTFNIDDATFLQLQTDIKFIKTTQAQGIVCGILTNDKLVDQERMKVIMALAKPLRVTFHRALDQVTDQVTALKILVDLGISTVLTSGGTNNIMNNIPNLQVLAKLNLPIKILAGGGINHHNLPILLENGIKNIHVGKTVRYHNSFAEPISSQLINDLLAMD